MRTSEDNAATEIANRVYEPSRRPMHQLGPQGIQPPRNCVAIASRGGAVSYTRFPRVGSRWEHLFPSTEDRMWSSLNLRPAHLRRCATVGFYAHDKATKPDGNQGLLIEKQLGAQEVSLGPRL